VLQKTSAEENRYVLDSIAVMVSHRHSAGESGMNASAAADAGDDADQHTPQIGTHRCRRI